MSLGQIFTNTPTWVWKLIGAITSIAGLIVSAMQIYDNYWNKVDNLVKGSVMQSTLKVTAEIKKTETSIGRFLIDDIQFRIISIQDEINVFIRANKKPPLYLKRQLNLLEDQLNEAKEKWEK